MLKTVSIWYLISRFDYYDVVITMESYFLFVYCIYSIHKTNSLNLYLKYILKCIVIIFLVNTVMDIVRHFSQLYFLV